MAGAHEITQDAIFHGALQLWQRRGGYRFTEDAVLVAAFAASGGRARVAADLGAGCGVVGLMLLHVGAAEHVAALELQGSLCRLASANARQNDPTERITAIRGDLRRVPFASRSLDLAVANPPYMPAGSGREPRGRERAVARHELSCTPAALASEASRCLALEGRLSVIYPADRAEEVDAAIADAGLRAARRRWVHPGPERPAGLLLLEARRGQTGFCIEEPPLFSRDAGGAYGAEMRALLAGRFDAWGGVSGAAGRL